MICETLAAYIICTWRLLESVSSAVDNHTKGYFIRQYYILEVISSLLNVVLATNTRESLAINDGRTDVQTFDYRFEQWRNEIYKSFGR